MILVSTVSPPAPSTGAAPHPLARCRDRETLALLNQQLGAAHVQHREAFQVPLTGRVVLQVAEITSAHREVLPALTKRKEDSNPDRHLGLRDLGDHWQAPGPGAHPHKRLLKDCF